MQTELSSFKCMNIFFFSIVTVADDRVLTFVYDMIVTLHNRTVTSVKIYLSLTSIYSIQNAYSEVYEIVLALMSGLDVCD